MTTPIFFSLALFAATLLCALVAGFLFAFAAVVMPGIKSLNDREFIRAFQRMDGIIQNRRPIFMLVWVGSIAALLASAALGIGPLNGYDRLLLISATLIYAVGVQLPTLAINVPLNNALQLLDVDAIDEGVQKRAREAFELRWNLWNVIRTAFASLTSAQLMLLLFRL